MRINYDKLNYEKQGNYTYLVYEIGEDDPMDNYSRNILTHNSGNIPGILRTQYSQEDKSHFIRFNVSTKVPASELFRSDVSKKLLLGVLNGVVDAMISVEEEYRLDPASLILDLDYIFVNTANCEAELVCLPLAELEQDADLYTFLRDVVVDADPDDSEDTNYYNKLKKYLKQNVNVAPPEFKKFLQELAGEVPAPVAQPKPVVAPVAAPVAAPVSAPDPTPAPASVPGPGPAQGTPHVHLGGEKPADFNAAWVMGSNSDNKPGNLENKPKVILSSKPIEDKTPAKKDPWKKKEPAFTGKIPGGSNVAIPDRNGGKPNDGKYKDLSNHFGPDAELNKNQKEPKEEKKSMFGNLFSGKQKPAKEKKQEPQIRQATPGKAINIPGQKSYVDQMVEKKAAEVQNREHKMVQHELQVPPTVDASNVISPTVDMSGMAAVQAQARIIRVSTNEEIKLTKPVFTLGRENVDYCVGEGNLKVSRKHASIELYGGYYYLVDLGSKWGTTLNGGQIQPEEKVRLNHGNEFSLADEAFTFLEY